MELHFEQVTVAYEKNKPVLQEFQLTIPSGQFVSLVGKSGCGKSTLLRLAAGLLAPDSGQVRLDGITLHKPHQDVGVVFQAPTLLEWLTVSENVLLPVSLHGRVSQADRQRASQLLELVGLAEFAGKYPLTLSGGQQSRVAIARALIREPSLLLLDEPFAALDALTREALQDDLLRLSQSRGLTTLFITHDIAEAVYLADRVIVMKAGKPFLDLPVSLPQPRSLSIRFGADFNQLCWRARTAMEEPA